MIEQVLELPNGFLGSYVREENNPSVMDVVKSIPQWVRGHLPAWL